MAKTSQMDRVIAQLRSEIADRQRMLDLLTTQGGESTGKATRPARAGKRGLPKADTASTGD